MPLIIQKSSESTLFVDSHFAPEMNTIGKELEHFLNSTLNFSANMLFNSITIDFSYCFEKEFEEIFHKKIKQIINNFLLENELDIFLVLPDNFQYKINQETRAKIQELINDLEIDEMTVCKNSVESSYQEDEFEIADFEYATNLDEIFKKSEETFHTLLFKFIDSKNLNDVEVYKKANISRKLFSKIRSNQDYQPSKPTVLSFAIALELNLDETNSLLTSAGYSLSNSLKFDIIIRFFIENEIYNIYEVNEALFSFNPKTLI